jgi:3-oxoacyl-[acyl-carrier-protein] synthase II
MDQYSTTQRNRHRVVVTGLGITTALGRGLGTCWPKLVAGESGIRPISYFDCSEHATKVSGEARDVPGDPGVPDTPAFYQRRACRMFADASTEAFRQARLSDVPIAPDQIGIAAGTSTNYLDMRLVKAAWETRRPDRLLTDPERLLATGAADEAHFYRRQGDMIGAVAARKLGLEGPIFLTDTACSASAHAIGLAYQAVRSGKVQAMIAGGAAALARPLSILAFALLGALSRGETSECARPFDKKRDGFVMGEGGGAVVLETLESARDRGVPILAEICGYGCTTSGHNLTDPSPGGRWEAQAMWAALAEAGMRPEQVDYIAAHGTSTPKNDVNETVAIKSVFGPHAYRLAVSSNKGHIGHTISAAGVCNVVFTVKAVLEGVAPPTLNLRNPDPECDLDYVPNVGRPARIGAALSNAFAFGGQNVSLAVRAWE